eukprot:scaffold1112_cov195-Alexandrium_tamarense.AAC.23
MSTASFSRSSMSQLRDDARSKGLQKLGVSEEDVQLAARLMQQIPTCTSDPKKAERILGFASSRLAREKALRLLGASEEEVEVENAKTMGALGIAGRRRSYSVMHSANQQHLLLLSKKSQLRKRTSSIVKSPSRTSAKHRRRSSAEIRMLRNQARTSAIEIESLRARIEELERTVRRSFSSNSDSSIHNIPE